MFFVGRALRAPPFARQFNMPPKKKEKGGKGGKGAGAVPNAFDEPPQPAPGSPYCLSLSLEVLLVDPSACTAETGLVPESGGGDGEDTNRGEQRTQPLLVEPVFRYTFVNGERIITPPVGLPGSSWTKLSPDAIGDAPREAEQSTTPLAPKASGAVDVDGEPGSDRGPSEPVMWRYTRTHQLLGADEDEVQTTMMIFASNIVVTSMTGIGITWRDDCTSIC